ncbi:MAG: hypothetical protein M3524_10415 [Actinomycetota bacterium]|nr:hypothetical protein [Actinomycetota bacterium]
MPPTANGRRVELLGELAALTALAEQLGPAWQSQVHAHSALELARRLGMAPLVDQLDALLGSGEGDRCSPLARPR